MAHLPLTQPPCCSIDPWIECKKCKWKACADHWFDFDDGEDKVIHDEWHVPTKPNQVDAKGDVVVDNSGVGVCIRCGSEEWDERG